jgi:hypothetical protein
MKLLLPEGHHYDWTLLLLLDHNVDAQTPRHPYPQATIPAS